MNFITKSLTLYSVTFIPVALKDKFSNGTQ